MPESVTIPQENGPMAGPDVSISDQRLADGVRAMALRLGFDAVGIARADLPLDQDIARFDAFIASKMHGEMEFLARHPGARARLDGSEILPGARSVVCLARRYAAGPARTDSPTASAIARYARGRDYHKFLRRRIRRLAVYLRSLGTVDHPVRARPLCDEEPILERAWAARAGLGFVGKNGLLIVPGTGSFVLLGEVVTTLALAPNTPMTERCGSCRRCLDACPTSAFAAPFVLDPRRCISYLTIEHRTAVPMSLREGVGDHLFGCDDCQTVCPFNAGSAARSPLSAPDGEPFDALERWSRLALTDLLTIEEGDWQALVEGSPLKRVGRFGLARNAALVLGNRRDQEAIPALLAAAQSHESPLVREAAAWAVAQIR